MMFHGSEQPATLDVAFTCQIEELLMHGEVQRLVSSLNLPERLVQDALNVHSLVKINGCGDGVESNFKLVSASSLFLAGRMQGCKVFMSSLLDASGLQPVQFRRAIIGMCRAMKGMQMEHEAIKENELK